MHQPTKLIGSVNWVDMGKCDKGRIRDAIYRTDSELALSLEYEGRSYEVSLKRQSGHTFSGSWSRREGNIEFNELLTCKVFTDENELFLFGLWKEDRIEYR
jgi:hypothetical protein